MPDASIIWVRQKRFRSRNSPLLFPKKPAFAVRKDLTFVVECLCRASKRLKPQTAVGWQILVSGNPKVSGPLWFRKSGEPQAILPPTKNEKIAIALV